MRTSKRNVVVVGAALLALIMFAGACSSDDLALSGANDVLVECYPDGVLVSTTENELKSVEVEVDGRRVEHTELEGFQHAVAEEGISNVWVESSPGDGFAGAAVQHECGDELLEGSLGDIPDALAFVDESGIDVSCVPEGINVTTSEDEITEVIATINGERVAYSGLSGNSFMVDDPGATTVWVASGSGVDFDGYALRHDCIRGLGIASAS